MCRSGGEPLPQMPLLPNGRPQGSIRRASASTASAMSTDTVSAYIDIEFAAPTSQLRFLASATQQFAQGNLEKRCQRIAGWRIMWLPAVPQRC